jgi:hypothetical protein
VDLLAASLCLGIDLAPSADELAAFWRAHQAVLERLEPFELELVIARKDRRKASLARS